MRAPLLLVVAAMACVHAPPRAELPDEGGAGGVPMAALQRAAARWMLGQDSNQPDGTISVPLRLTQALTGTSGTFSGTVDALALKGDSLQTHTGGATALSIGTTGSGSVTIGNATSGPVLLSSGVMVVQGAGTQINGFASIGVGSTNFLGVTGNTASNPVTLATSGTNAGLNVTTTGTGIMSYRSKPVLTVLNSTVPIGLQCGEKATSSGVVTITFASETNGVAFGATPVGCWCTNTSNTTENTCSTTGESSTQVTLNGTTSDTYTWCCLGAAP